MCAILCLFYGFIFVKSTLHQVTHDASIFKKKCKIIDAITFI